MSNLKKTLFRYLFATIGLFFVALGIALSIVSDFGTAPLSCPSYVLNLKFTSISVGTFTFIVNMIYILIQLVLFKDKFQKSYLLQIVASAILGYLINLCLWMCSWLVIDTIILKIVVTVLACLVTALGISIELTAGAWMLSAELTTVGIVYAFPKLSFGTAKILMDSAMVLLSAIAAYFFFGHILGNGTPHGVVISWGTIILAFLPGYMIKYTDILVDKIQFYLSKL